MNRSDAGGPRRSERPQAFLSAAEQRTVVEAIQAAERCTSGEIRVHLERRCKGGDPLARGRQVFEHLGLAATAARNGVLIYVAVGNRQFAVLGDQGIDRTVPTTFWDEIVAAMAERFRADDFAGGLVLAIGRIGARLAEHFPPLGAADRNELPDDISSA